MRNAAAHLLFQSQTFSRIAGGNTATVYFKPQVPHELQFATHTIPATPRSHAFVERLIGTIRREYLDRIWFWSQTDLERKLEDYKVFYNQYRCHTGLAGLTPAQRSGAPPLPHVRFDSYRWRQHCKGLFQTPAAA